MVLSSYTPHQLNNLNIKIMSCSTKPLPLMFVGRDVDHAFIGNFMKKKYYALCQSLGSVDNTCIYCSTGDFKTLVETISTRPDAIRMKAYFASLVDPSLFTTIPTSYFGTTTLVFCAVNSKELDVEDYYTISPVGGIIPLTKDSAHLMVKYFQDNRAVYLQQVAQAAGRPSGFKETKAVWYEIKKLTDSPGGWLDELNCQGAIGTTICLAAYPVKSVYPFASPNGTPIDWQLTLIFLLTKKTQTSPERFYCYDLEDLPDYDARFNLTDPPAGGGDTANPCPPGTGCTSSVGNP
jgi:hypothetical protein